LTNNKVVDYLTRSPTNFSALEMFKLQHQYNNIVETTQLTNNQMPEFIVTMNVQSVEAPTQASSRLI